MQQPAQGDGTGKILITLRNMRFSDPTLFEGMPEHVVRSIVQKNPYSPDAPYSSERLDIVRGLVHGYQTYPDFFEDYAAVCAASGRWGMLELVRSAQSRRPSSPLSILFGVPTDVIKACTVKNKEQLAGLARFAVAGVDSRLLPPYEKFDAAEAPTDDDMEAFATHRLHVKFSSYSPWFEMMDCTDLEKYCVLHDFQRNSEVRHHSFAGLTWMFAEVGRLGLPLHRVLRAFARTGDVHAALTVWDMPEEYLTALVGEES